MKLILFCVFVSSVIIHIAIAQTKNKHVCSQPVEIGPCRQNQPQFFFDTDTQDCDLFLYGGCGGNDNRFDDLATCQKVCMGKNLADEKNVHLDASVTPSSRVVDYDDDDDDDDDDDVKDNVSSLKRRVSDTANDGATVVNNNSQTEL